MTPVGALELIASTVETSWAGTPVADVAFPGQRFAAPADRAYLRLTVRALTPTSTTHGTVNGRLVQQRGLLIVEAYHPISIVDGSIAVMELATAFRDLFQGKSLGADPLHFETAAPDFKGDFGAHAQANVVLPFTYHERI